ncbi:MAG: zinc ABC transporter substrate-binding protein [Firmicutes bacterium]|nr:zinc ABC transporter substrate-binding protein [Bacillota bacterium]
MKKIFIVFVMILLLAGCTAQVEEGDKLTVVAVNFPGYDFARQVCGEGAEVIMLVKPGMESHSYEPSPQDMILIEQCDLFIYAGGESDEWVKQLLESVHNDMGVISMLDCVEGLEEEHIHHGWEEHMHEHHDHNHDELDEHVWTDPANAALIAHEIAHVMAELDPTEADTYEKNAHAYNEKMLELDQQFQEIVDGANRNVLIFADRFPMRYFTHRYELEYYAAFSGCSHETEPSAATLVFLIDKVREEQIPVVLQMDLSDGRTADTVCAETGAVKRTFYSGHTVTAEQLENGITYEELMRMNLDVLKEALG